MKGVGVRPSLVADGWVATFLPEAATTGLSRPTMGQVAALSRRDPNLLSRKSGSARVARPRRLALIGRRVAHESRQGPEAATKMTQRPEPAFTAATLNGFVVPPPSPTDSSTGCRRGEMGALGGNKIGPSETIASNGGAGEKRESGSSFEGALPPRGRTRRWAGRIKFKRIDWPKVSSRSDC